MIEREKPNGGSMELTAECTWGEAYDVMIMQKWSGGQQGTLCQFVAMDIEEAESLMIELRSAIDKAREYEAGYAAFCAESAKREIGVVL